MIVENARIYAYKQFLRTLDPSNHYLERKGLELKKKEARNMLVVIS